MSDEFDKKRAQASKRVATLSDAQRAALAQKLRLKKTQNASPSTASAVTSAREPVTVSSWDEAIGMTSSNADRRLATEPIAAAVCAAISERLPPPFGKSTPTLETAQELELLPTQAGLVGDYEREEHLAGRWVLDRLFRLPLETKYEELHRNFSLVCARHPSLRSVLSRVDGRLRLMLTDEYPSPPFLLAELGGLGGSDEALAAEAARQLSGHAPVIGGPLTFGVFLRGASSSFLYLHAHHMLFDLLSLHLFVEELERAILKREESQLLPRSAGIALATRLRSWLEEEEADRLTSDLQRSAQSFVPEAPVDFTGGENLVGGERITFLQLDGAARAQLVSSVLRNSSVSMLPVLVASLARSLQAWSGAGPTAIELVGAGRDRVFGIEGLHEAVGWLAHTYAVRIPMAGTSEPRGFCEAVAAQCEEQRRCSWKALAIAYLGPYLRGERLGVRVPRAAFQAPYCLNVLPHDGDRTRQLVELPIAQPAGPDEELQPRPKIFDFVAQDSGKQLTLAVTWSPNLHREDTARNILSGWAEQLHLCAAAL